MTMTLALTAPGRMNEEEARQCAQAIKEHLTSARALLLDFDEREGWRALGYGSWRAWATAEMGQSQTHVYEELAAAKVERNLSAIAEIRVGSLPEGRLRPLTRLEPDEQRAVAATLDLQQSTGAEVEQAVAAFRAAGTPAASVEPAKFYTVAAWEALTVAEQAAALRRRDSKHTFNQQTSDNIEWAQWSWNPITGCLHNCSFCYARDIAARYYEQGFVPAFLPARLVGPRNTHVPERAGRDMGFKNVFTCSMADLFGRWVPTDWIEAVLGEVRDNPQWNFLFLTKFPTRLQDFDFPENAWVGTSVDAQARVANAERAFASVRASVKWLSCEPLLEPLRFSRLDLFDWIVIGGASASTQTPEWRPPRPWIDDLERQARDAGIEHVYEKTNLWSRRREFPGQARPERISVPDAFKMPYLQRDVLEPEAYAAEVQP